MHRLSPRRRDERGAVAIVVAMIMTALLVVTALVLDFGLVRLDRQIDRAAADEATMAGLYALDQGDGAPHPYAGVCSAIRYLKANSARFASAPETTGWTDGNGAATSDGCAAAKKTVICQASNKTTWAAWSWTSSYQGLDFTVRIASGYDLSVNDDWKEDSLTATSGDVGTSGGCDNLAVTVEQSRKPGLGSLATSSDLSTAIRTVGRIRVSDGDTAPAMLLLKQTGCPVLTTGASGGSSFIRVLGAISTDGLNKTQPGTIHSDSDGSGCTGGNNANRLYNGLANDGVVAYAAPLATNTSAPDPSKPGLITSYAASIGVSGTPVRDALNYVYSSNALNYASGPGTRVETSGRPRVTRKYIDERYFPAVKGAISTANTLFLSGATSAPSGWSRLSLFASNVCKPTQAEMNNAVANANSVNGGRLYIGCTGPNGFEGDTGTLTINAQYIYFKGMVGPASNVAIEMPNARKVYIGNHLDKPSAINISNNTSFQINNAAANLTGGNCSTGQSASKSLLVVRAGSFKQTGGLLRMCRTTAIMMGGSSNGCVPATAGTAPNALTPCGGGLGTGQFSQSGSYSSTTSGIDWTAPDTIDATTDASGNALATATAAWQDQDGPEDLALWSESGSNSSTTYSQAGGGLFRVRGVFMVPNASPFIISGGASLNLTNAQYIATSIELNGNTTNITMSVDPNAAVTVPDVKLIGMVR